MVWVVDKVQLYSGTPPSVISFNLSLLDWISDLQSGPSSSSSCDHPPLG